jgi:hypothetical protein
MEKRKETIVFWTSKYLSHDIDKDFKTFQFIHNSLLVHPQESRELVENFKKNPEILFEFPLPQNYFQIQLEKVTLVYKIVFKRRLTEKEEYRYILLGHILKRNIETRIAVLDQVFKDNFGEKINE